MNLAMQPFGDGLAALLFCFAVCFPCQKIKKLASRFLRQQELQAAEQGDWRQKGL